ncbi:MAG: hypothetical protein Q9221_001488 [Calogaya cf. arnoldii]
MARNKTIRKRKTDAHNESTPTPHLVSLPSEILCMVVKQIWDQLKNFEKITSHTGLLSDKHIRSGFRDVNLKPTCGGIYFPSTLTSTHLNTLVRLLIRRLPKRSLTEFVWDHACFMNSQTFQLLLEHQRQSLRTLKIHNYQDGQSTTKLELCIPGISSKLDLLIPGIRSLSINNVGDRHALSVATFLISQSSKTLKHLCLGAEDTAVRIYRDPPNDFKTILDRHGKHLRSLVWDERTRGMNADPTDMRFSCFTPHSRIVDIQESCPNLVELGIPMEWNLFSDTWDGPHSLKKQRTVARERLSMMRNLRTLNIRNMPYIDAETAARLSFPEARSHGAYAESVLDVILDYSKVSRLDIWPPPLDTLVLGSFMYRDHRNGLGCWRIIDERPYKYCQPRGYRIDRQYHHEGRRKPLAILHETGTYEKTEAAGGSVELLKPYWLA